MMHWKSLGCLVILLFLSNLFWIYESNKDKEVIDDMISSIASYSKRTYVLNLLTKARQFELNMTNSAIPLNLEIKNIHGKNIKIKELLHTNKLVMRYTDLNCYTCINEQIQNLNSYIDSIGVNNVLGLISASNPNYIYHFKKINRIDFDLYNVEQSNIKIPDIGIPYFFILTTEGKISNVFVPYKEFPEYTSQFLHLSKNVLTNN